MTAQSAREQITTGPCEPEALGVKRSLLTRVVDIRVCIHIRTVPADAINDVHFLQAVRDNDGSVQINHRILFRVNVNNEDMWEDLDRMGGNLDKLIRLLERLGVDPKQDMGMVDERVFNILYSGIVENHAFPISAGEKQGAGSVWLGNHLIGVAHMRMRESEDIYHICDLFDIEQLMVVAGCFKNVSDSGEELRYVTSLYSAVGHSSLAQISNLHPENVVESFRKVFISRNSQPESRQDDITQHLLSDANQTVLRMVQAADMICRGEAGIPDCMRPGKWEMLLKAANELNQWILEFGHSYDPIVMINGMQIKLRLGTFNERDRSRSRRLIEASVPGFSKGVPAVEFRFNGSLTCPPASPRYGL